MKINLNLINESYNIDDVIDIPCSYYEHSLIKNINGVKVKGKIYYDLIDQIKIELHCEGEMTLEDSNTLKEIKYPFSFDIDNYLDDFNANLLESIKKNQNTLDICELLWENIVLEVPIRITKDEDIHLKGNGWELNGKKSSEIDPRLEKLTQFKGGE